MVSVTKADALTTLRKELKRRNAELMLYREVLKESFPGSGFQHQDVELSGYPSSGDRRRSGDGLSHK